MLVPVHEFQLIEYSRLTALIGYILSMAALVFAIAIFVALRKLHCRRNSIHLHCFVSFFFRALLCVIETLTSLSKTQESTPCNTDQCSLDLGFMENWQCKSFALLWNFAIISNYFWILVEGLYLHNIIYFSVFQETRITFYVIFGWGTPILIMIPWVYVKLIYDNTSCWITYCNLKYMWFLRAPVGIAVVVNFIFFCLIVRELHIKLSTDNQFSDQSRYRKLAKSTLILIMVLGIHYILFDVILLITNWDFTDSSMSTILVHSVSVIVNSTLGLAVAYFYCFCNHEVRTELKKRWREWRSMKQKTTSNSHNSTTATCDHIKKPHRIFNSTATLQHSRSLLGLRRKTAALNSCSECQIRLQLLNTQRGMLRPPANGDFLNPEGTSTQCSTVVNSAQNTLTRTTGRRFMAAAGVEAVTGQRTNHLSNCWEDNESLEGSSSNAVSPAFLSISAHDESNSDNFVSCSDTQLPAALRQLYTDSSKQEETI
uniref:G-protein coupled receptors family 2 profile 2 domain-containing protein n=1 Tax=Plectus sambesii TaxID=2011161 RepID=A0A914UV08_9BILA